MSSVFAFLYILCTLPLSGLKPLLPHGHAHAHAHTRTRTRTRTGTAIQSINVLCTDVVLPGEYRVFHGTECGEY